MSGYGVARTTSSIITEGTDMAPAVYFDAVVSPSLAH